MNLKNLLKKAESAKDKIEDIKDKVDDVKELADKFDDTGIKDLIKKFLEAKKSGADLDDDTDLFKNGYVNSLFALEIVTFLEKTFNIKLSKNDISKENFSSINNITSLVKKLLKK